MSRILESNKEVAGEFARFGGRYHNYEDEDGGYWEVVVDKFRVHIEAWRNPVQPLRKPPTERSSLRIECAIGHTELGALAGQILGQQPDTFRCMRWEDHAIEVSDDEPMSEAFGRLLSSFLAELRRRGLEHFITEFRKPPPDKGNHLFHLAALAWVGDFATLEEYYAIFKRGKRLNFQPMITAEMIDRAVNVAMDRFYENR